MEFKFYKNFENKWYIDIPNWTGSIDDLEMVSGADVMLNIMTQGDNEIYLTISDKPFELIPLVKNLDNSHVDISKYKHPKNTILTKIKNTPDIGGAEYNFDQWCGIDYNITIWLCGVTEHVFSYLPDRIYII